MALFVLCDAAYRHGVWCDTKLRGIADEASRRRIQTKVFTCISEVRAATQKCSEEVSVILLYDNMSWLYKAINGLSDTSVHFILSANYIAQPLPITYSLVGTDADGSMKNAVDYLHMCKKERIALVGVNRNSCNDTGREKMFCKYVHDGLDSIFYINESMLDSFDEFAKVHEQFDAVICTNDLVAICLIEYLKSHGIESGKLFVISHTDTVMARLYGDGITSVTTNFYDCGRLLVETYFNRIKYGLVASKNLLPTVLKIRGSTDNIAYDATCESIKPSAALRLEEHGSIVVQTGDIGRLERVLATSDLVNLKLIYCLICGYNYKKMSEYCFISPETAQYRVRKIKTALGVQKKSDVADFIRKYIKKESLMSVIGEAEEKNNQFLCD